MRRKTATAFYWKYVWKRLAATRWLCIYGSLRSYTVYEPASSLPSVARDPPFIAKPLTLIGIPRKLRDSQSTIVPNHHGSYPAKWKEACEHPESEPRKPEERHSATPEEHSEQVIADKVPTSPQASAQAMPFMVPLAAKSSDGSSDAPDSGVHFNKIIQILVGPQEKPFISHKSILIKIPFFKNCLRNEMLEAAKVVQFAYWQSMSYDLPELYKARQDDGVLLRAYPLPDKFLLTVKVYILAEKLGVEALQNMAVDMLQKTARYEPFFPGVFLEIMAKTRDDDKLRKLAMDCTAWVIKLDGWDKWKQGTAYQQWMHGSAEASEMVAAALAHLVRDVSTAVRYSAPWEETDECSYHTPVETAACEESYGRPPRPVSYDGNG